MMAKLWTQQIIDGKKQAEQVPRLLKERVREMLIDCGLGDLMQE